MLAFRGSTHPATHPAPTTLAPTTTAAPIPTTTIDPGTLAQTTDRPSSTDPAFELRIQQLWQAITSGQAAVALPAFFPLAAYKQVKAINDPAYDWQHRLLGEYFGDIARVHASLGAAAASARLDAVQVPDAAATWVRPGAEVNKIGYWRVYNTTLRYTEGSTSGAVVIISLISWRGQWYVVHFRTPPS